MAKVVRAHPIKRKTKGKKEEQLFCLDPKFILYSAVILIYTKALYVLSAVPLRWSKGGQWGQEGKGSRCLKSYRYGLNICVPSKFTCWNPNSQYYVIRSWGLQYDHEGRAPMYGISVSIRRYMTTCLLFICSLSFENTKRQLSANQEACSYLTTHPLAP